MSQEAYPWSQKKRISRWVCWISCQSSHSSFKISFNGDLDRKRKMMRGGRVRFRGRKREEDVEEDERREFSVS